MGHLLDKIPALLSTPALRSALALAIPCGIFIYFRARSLLKSPVRHMPRGSRRIRCQISATVRTAAGRQRCVVLDMSERGLLLSLRPETPVLEGDTLEVLFPVGPVPMAARARVIHLGRKGPHLCGVQLLSLHAA